MATVLVVAAVAVGALAQSAAAQTAGFDDVPPGAYYAAPVADLHARGVFDGTVCAEGFCPAEPLPRWAVAVWLVRVLDGADPPTVGSRFADVAGSPWWEAHVERLAELGVTVGCRTEPLRFCPDRHVSRAQMATFLARAFRLPASPDAGFADVAADSAHHAGINALAASGVTVGCRTEPLRFCPHRSTTRAQMATFLYRAARLVDDSPSQPAAGVPARLRGELASYALELMNSYRHDSHPVLELDDALTAVAQANAQAMAEASDYLLLYDFVSALDARWDVWSVGVPVSTPEPLERDDTAEALARGLLGEEGSRLAPCPRCTHLATGVAKAGGDAYAIVLMAGKIPGERLTEEQTAAAEAEMTALVNNHRRAAGLDPLAHSAQIAAAARRWSTTMGAGHDFRHNPRAGYDYPPDMAFAGENIAAARLWGTLTITDVIKASFADLANSPPHNAAMLKADTTHIGVGVVHKQGWIWITQNFGKHQQPTPGLDHWQRIDVASGRSSRSAAADRGPERLWEGSAAASTNNP